MTFARDRVTTPLRAPFVRYERDPATGDLAERPYGRGLHRALGQLVTCPYCMGPWIAGLFLTGLSLVPRTTRTVAGIFAINAVSNFLHAAYGRLRRAPDGREEAGTPQ